MEVFLANVGNPDFGQNPERPLPGTLSKIWHPVASYQEASEACRRYIEDNNLGGGNWCGGQIIDGDPRGARVAYNGRVFRGRAYKAGQEVLYEPGRSTKP